MANLQQYTKAVVYVNSSVLSEEASVTIKRTSGSQPVKTVAKGYAGESPGSPMTEITVSNAVPSADFELNPGQYINLLDIVEVTIFAAGRTLTVKGSIIDDNFSHAVDSEAKLEFNFRGGPSDWQ
ncbi:hypothetical protein [Polyangium sp. 15x6]|uniref:hypothetical protein n=1 Tax=Polyangium sp. 15x6 TaxID=3042687 RepID=UPI00249CF23E|nr:hypothetical protein [Polyangium sp. 15x6]MDI3282114.1 hypothetical protein [Polyangium sp. 15x6]